MTHVPMLASSHRRFALEKKVITDMKARLKDPDLARLFENTFPNTLGVSVISHP